MSAMEDTVRSFNKLLRPSTAPTGLPNHWVFGTRHIAVNPPGDLVLAVHPKSQFILQAGPVKILSLPTASAKAAAIIPLLLDLFIKGSESPGGRRPSDPEPFAPWTWSMDDPELVPAIAEGLKRHGVLGELQNPSICSNEERDLLDEVSSRRTRLLEQLMNMMGCSAAEAATVSVIPGDRSKCHGCGLGQESFSQKLMGCSACSQAFYHSQTCQRQHWKQHKPTCLANRSSSNQPSASSATTTAYANMGAYDYYNTVARTAPDAQALLRSLKIDPASPEGLIKPMRRLVITGQDSPENMELLFGPNCRRDAKHEETRIDILLDPPRGSPSYASHSCFDDKALGRSPRPATDAEQRKITQVREMQEAIRQRVGAARRPSKEDMMAILTGPGPNWTAKLPMYTLAANTMDQGVRT